MLIGIVALVVIGPERLPRVARTVGHLLGRAQRYVSDVKNDIQREVELDELRKMKEEMESAAHSIQNSFEQNASSIKQEVQEPLDQLKADLDATRQSVAGQDLTSLSSGTSPPVHSIAPDKTSSGVASSPEPASVASKTRSDTEQKT